MSTDLELVHFKRLGWERVTMKNKFCFKSNLYNRERYEAQIKNQQGIAELKDEILEEAQTFIDGHSEEEHNEEDQEDFLAQDDTIFDFKTEVDVDYHIQNVNTEKEDYLQIKHCREDVKTENSEHDVGCDDEENDNLETDNDDDGDSDNVDSDPTYEAEETVPPDLDIDIKPDILKIKNSCKHCEFIGENRQALSEHKLKLHSEQKCEICNSTYKDYRSLKRHKQDVHSEKAFKCTQCNYSCTTARYLNKHMMTHDENNKYQCDYCEYSAYTKTTLNIHMNAEHLGSEFIKNIFLPILREG